jgi:hypothetical protein
VPHARPGQGANAPEGGLVGSGRIATGRQQRRGGCGRAAERPAGRQARVLVGRERKMEKPRVRGAEGTSGPPLARPASTRRPCDAPFGDTARARTTGQMTIPCRRPSLSAGPGADEPKGAPMFAVRRISETTVRDQRSPRTTGRILDVVVRCSSRPGSPCGIARGVDPCGFYQEDEIRARGRPRKSRDLRADHRENWRKMKTARNRGTVAGGWW